MTPAKKLELLKIFAKLYPDPQSELNFSNDYQLIVSVILSAQCTDKKVNEVTPKLFGDYPNFLALSKAARSDIEEILRPINYYKTKSKNVLEMSKIICTDFSGKLPRTHKELTTLPGVGQKTANVIMNEKGIAPSFPVDTHVFRVSKRLGLACGNKPEVVEEELKKEFRAEVWRNLHHWLIFHGRRICKAQRPNCAECSLSKLCPSVEKH